MLHIRVIPTLALALALTGCVRLQDLDGPTAARDAVCFDAYSQPATKAGYAGPVDLSVLKSKGFGVYGYVSASEPDFMSNQHISWNGLAWTYSPLKYWPNDNTPVSFFAYAPYVSRDEVTSSTCGIISLPANDAAIPEIGYRVADKPEQAVDLMYGVNADGLPFLNMGKQKLGEKIKYHFRHALTKLTVNVDADFYVEDPNTRVVIESVTLSTTRLSTTGTLNLHNDVANTPKWTPGAALSNYSLPIAYSLKHVAGGYSQQPLGVTGSAQPLMGYAPDGTTPVSMLFVPASDSGDLTVAITYRIITRDTQVQGGYTETVNQLSSNLAMPFAAGTTNTLNLHLGVASVRCDASVADWNTGTPLDQNLPSE